MNVSGLPVLDNILLVDGLKANLISISQLCDQDLTVTFTKNDCKVTREDNSVFMKGLRSPDNCYMWSGPSMTSASCLLSQTDATDLWHKRLGHLNLRSLGNLVSKEAVRGLPYLKIKEGKICGQCQVGKQVCASHKKVDYLTTSRVLELLHMDLMGPMQVESLGGRRYILVVVDDYSRYTWVGFLQEKSDAFEAFQSLSVRLQREKENSTGKIMKIRSDHGKEFENGKFLDFCSS